MSMNLHALTVQNHGLNNICAICEVTMAHYSPFDCIPDELISDILLISYQHGHPNWLLPLLNIQLVCRRWREVTRNTPGFWTFLHIRKPPFQHIVERLELSGSLLLQIVVDIESNEDVKEWICVMTPHIHRWWSLHLRLVSIPVISEQERILESIFCGSMPQLSSLAINAIPIGVRRRALECFAHILAPSLRSLHIAGYELDWGRLPFTGLKELDVEIDVPVEGTLREFLEVISGSPDLHVLRIRGQRFFNHRLLTQESIELLTSQRLVLETLDTLEIWGLTYWEGSILLSIIEGPSLIRLDLDLQQFHAALDFNFFPTLPSTGFPLLHTLRLGNMSIAHDLLCRILIQLIPSTTRIRRLVLDGGVRGAYYQLRIHSLLFTLLEQDFQNMWKGIEHLATRRCSPAMLYSTLKLLYPLPSLKSLHVYAVDTKPSEARTTSKQQMVDLERDVENLKSFMSVQAWGDEDDLPWDDPNAG